MAGTVHSLENPQLVEQVEQEAAQAARQLAEAAHLRRGQIVVIGCSTSEVVGHQVGSWSTPEVADAIFRGLNSVFAPMGVYMAAQCCEHLNRALIVEQAAVPGAEIVNVVPQPKAGSSFATAAYHAFRHPVALEESGLAGIRPKQLQSSPGSLMVTPRDIDQQVRDLGKVIGYGINWALQDLEIEEINALLS